MADYIVERQTHIMVATNTSTQPLYPSDTLYPADDLYPRDAELVEVNNIVAGSMQLDEMLVDKEPILGLFFSSKFECQLYDTEEDFSGRYIHVYQTENGARRSVFTGYVDSCKRDKVGTDRTLIAYDLAYHWGSVDVSGWWNSFWELPEHENGATVRDIRNSLIGTFKFQAEDIALPNDDKVVPKTIGMHSASFASIMMMLCEISCCYPHFDRDGILRFIILDTSSTDSNLLNLTKNLTYAGDCEAVALSKDTFRFRATSEAAVVGLTAGSFVNGNTWGFRPTEILPIGEYTIKISCSDASKLPPSGSFPPIVEVRFHFPTIDVTGAHFLFACRESEQEYTFTIPETYQGVPENPDGFYVLFLAQDLYSYAVEPIEFTVSLESNNSDGSSSVIDLTDRYEWNNSDFEVYETNPVTGIQFFDSEDQLKYTVGSDENAYGIHKNVFLYDAGTEELEQIGQTMLSYLKDFRYTPSNVKMIVGDLSLHLGDRVSTEQGTFYIFQNAYSGSQLIEQTIKAEGTMELDSVAKPINFDSIVLAEKISRVQYNVEAFYIEYQDVTNGMRSEYRQTASEIRQEVSDKTTSAYIITKINQNGDDEKIVSSVEIGADVIDIKGIVKLLEAEEIRTVLNGSTGGKEATRFIRYTGSSIEFFEGDYNDYDKMAELSYNGLDYYRNNSWIGRYTTGFWASWNLTNYIQTSGWSASGLSVTKDGTSGVSINGTTSRSVVVYPIFTGTSLTMNKVYKFLFRGTNLPSETALEVYARSSDGTKTRLCEISKIASGKSFSFTAYYTTSISNSLELRTVADKAVAYNNTKLEFRVTSVEEENQRQYGMSIILREGGDYWTVSSYDSSAQTSYAKLFYAKNDIYGDKARTTKQYSGNTLYAFAPFEFWSQVTIKAKTKFENYYTWFTASTLHTGRIFASNDILVPSQYRIWLGGDRQTDYDSLDSSSYNKFSMYEYNGGVYFQAGSNITNGIWLGAHYNGVNYNVAHFSNSDGYFYLDMSAKTNRLQTNSTLLVNSSSFHNYQGYVASGRGFYFGGTLQSDVNNVNTNTYNKAWIGTSVDSYNNATKLRFWVGQGLPNGFEFVGEAYDSSSGSYRLYTLFKWDKSVANRISFHVPTYFEGSARFNGAWSSYADFYSYADIYTTGNITLAGTGQGGSNYIMIRNNAYLEIGNNGAIYSGGDRGVTKKLEVGLSTAGYFEITIKNGIVTNVSSGPAPGYDFINVY